MKSIMIAAPASGNGKTTLTLGILRALKNRGLDVCAYKTGPDYIDRAFLETASGKPAGNLDMHLQGREGMYQSLSLSNSEYGVIEGVMGYFDGIYNTWQNSSYHISRLLDIPTLLVYSPKGEMFSAIPKIQGMCDFEGSTISMVVFNQVTEHYYQLLKEAVEEHTNLKVLGYIPKTEAFSLKSRHLGLIQEQEIENLDQTIDHIAQIVEEQLDLNSLIEAMRPVTLPKAIEAPRFPHYGIRVAIAKDRAFSFYYKENLEMLEACCEVSYFSPLSDEKIPDCDLLYLGGGYPEVYRQRLSQNTAMLESIRAFVEDDGYVFAECGGFMFLTDFIEEDAMVGIFPGKSSLTKRLQRFGYIDLKLKEHCLLGEKGDSLTAHEFHKSISDVKGKSLFQIQKTMGEKSWECGFQYKNVLAGYPHIHFLGNQKAFQHMLFTVQQATHK
ncbi:MAG: cobyrinic acid a,c-diamide synthase [SAR324 cluster bacterium]|uniref:Cobyrinic acid a,c-diamide synthase n=1 Tax=SAR324 cluster bacterium TaxID=2024889 RepID=A0A2A4SUB1_9DELT|nr:MAG: cobyrinic acid a,c-diamide synthase [SAR324 cluster bacterium]